MPRLLCVLLVGLGACAFEPGGPGPDDDPGLPDPGLPADVDAGTEVTTPPDPPRTVPCRVDDDDLGVIGLQVTSPAGTHTFASWTLDDDGAPVGFELTGPSSLRYEVRTERDEFWGDALTWLHPQMAQGRADPITRVDLCAWPGGDD